MKYALAVIDIGMTNKKVAVYDDTLHQLSAEYCNFPPELIDGLETHNLAGMESWFIEKLADAAKHFPVKAITITTHGATFVCVGKDAKPVVPCVYYTYEPGEDFHRRFYEQFGAPEALQQQTGTPAFKSMINPAQGIFFIKEIYPEYFAKTTHLLWYPQYWGFRFTGKTGSEGTYMGCHTYMWNQLENKLSSVAHGLGVDTLIPEQLGNSWDILGTITGVLAEKTGLSPDTIVTMGIHDSNSSLLPYFAKKGEIGFVLNSTGTWCVIMNPVKKYGFSENELGKVVFFNISAFRKPVKTAIFLGGQEFETWSKVLMNIHQRKDIPGYNAALYFEILKESQAFLMPELTPGSGQFPLSKARIIENGRNYIFAEIADKNNIPPVFKDYEKGIALLRISLVLQTLTALERAGLERGAEVFTEGGFRKDTAYNTLLSSALPDNRVFLTDIAEATAFGAAMTAKMAITSEKLSELAGDFDIEYKEVPKSDESLLGNYRSNWLKYTG
ncbi:hypothetical protein FACS1894172_17440 [Spirochaetia bacterium]|nr:hypothetical protein FACS1894164_01590 [Spirochaetia bacterium]GHU35522.1 hypothetical protein FACS1894172_17440 [Spirochaetia bacterium]